MKRGLISYDHLHKSEKDPKYHIGEPLDVRFTDDNETLVKAKLYPSNAIANDIKSKLKDGSTRVGSSIGGYITKRQKVYSNKLKKSMSFITGIIWDEVALTMKPVNANTFNNVSVMPFNEFKKSFTCENYNEEVFKSLTAGSGTDHSNFTGGRALTSESLEGSTVKTIGSKDVKKYLQIVVDGKVRSYKDLINLGKSLNHSVDQIDELAVYVIKNFDSLKNLI